MRYAYMKLIDLLKAVPEFRDRRGRRHELWVILLIVVKGLLTGANTISKMALDAKLGKEWYLEKFGIDKIPSRDTIRRALAKLEPEKLQTALCEWLLALVGGYQGHHIAIDGKGILAATRRVEDGNTPYILNVFDVDLGILIWQYRIPAKKNEISSLPIVIDCLKPSGCLISTDAIGLQKKIVQLIVSLDADFLINLKGNQESLMDDVEGFFEIAKEEEVDEFIGEDEGHGRKTVRRCRVITLHDDMVLPDWPQVKCVAKVDRMVTRKMKGLPDEVTKDSCLYVSSRVMNAQTFESEVRKHWGIEGALHGVLDGSAFREDKCTSRTGNSMENLSFFRKFVLSLIKHDDGRFEAYNPKSFAEVMHCYSKRSDAVVDLLNICPADKLQDAS